MKASNIIYALLLGATLTACNEVDICESEHPHKANAQFTFDLDKYEAEKTDTMGVLAYRVVNQFKCLARVNSTDLNMACSDDKALAEDRKTLKISEGEYRFYTFPLDDKEIDYSELDDFIASKSADYPIRNVGFTYRQYDINDPELKKKLTEWLDYNPYSKYIQPDASPILYDTTAVINVERDQHITQSFKPKSLSQNVDVVFHIDKKVNKTPFIIDEVWAELSGIPVHINLLSRHLEISKTAKIMFPITLTAKNGDKTDSFENTTLTCKGNINVMGVVNVQRSKGETIEEAMYKTYGPGIMQVIIYGHSVDPVSGKTRHKKWQGIINLYRPILAADLMKVSDDGLYVTRSRERGTINVTARLSIDGEKIVAPNTESHSFGEWIPTVDILLDI